MPISPAPIRAPIVDSSVDTRYWVLPPQWVGWLQEIWYAIRGWRRTSYLSVADGVTVLNISAQSSLTVNYTVPNAVTTDSVSAYSNNDYGSGIVFSARVSAADTVEVRFHNYTAGAIMVTVGTMNFILYQQQ